MQIVHAILAIVATMLVLQLWLLTATVHAWLGGDRDIAWPAALASVVCLALNAGLLRYLYALER